VQAGDQGTLGGQVIFQHQDPQHGSQRVALVEQPLIRTAKASWRGV
jgi:hypothetical protein